MKGNEKYDNSEYDDENTITLCTMTMDTITKICTTMTVCGYNR